MRPWGWVCTVIIALEVGACEGSKTYARERTMNRKRLVVGLGLLASVVFTARQAPAVPSAADSCAATKQKAASKAAASEMSCYVKATQKQTSVDVKCLTKAQNNLTVAFTKAEAKAKGGCVDTGDVASIESMLETFTTNVVATTQPAAAVRCCSFSGLAPTDALCNDLSLASQTLCADPVGFDGTLAAPGLACDGKSGTCLPARVGNSTCCDGLAGGGCFEGVNAASFCAYIAGLGGFGANPISHPGERCLPSGSCGP